MANNTTNDSGKKAQVIQMLDELAEPGKSIWDDFYTELDTARSGTRPVGCLLAFNGQHITVPTNQNVAGGTTGARY